MSFSSPNRAAADDADPLPFHAVRIDGVRQLCRHAASIDRPLELEQWTSAVLGRVWARRVPLPDLPDEDLMFVVGKPILDACLAIGGKRGKLVLDAIARIDRGQLGVVAGVFADAIPRARLPPWMSDVGSASVVRAFSASVPGDGEAIVLHVERGRNDGHMVATFIDDQLGGIAKWLHLMRVIDPLNPDVTGGDGSVLQFRETDPDLACRRVRTAIERTDADRSPPVGDGFSTYRALAIARVTPQPNPLTLPVAS